MLESGGEQHDYQKISNCISLHFIQVTMAPKRRPVNVVRSGNAGNSSKPAKPGKDGKDGKDGAASDAPARPPPLFPIGYKSPVTLLNEKCQKGGWERPIIETVSMQG